ncbi:hypothetical protein Tco_1117453, partial [Tanacetum coccineum]
MATLKFAETYNLVAFLSKPEESDGFEQIAKTVNEEVQIQALVDGKTGKNEGKEFSGKDTPLFQIMMVQAQEEGEGSAMPTDPHHTPT